MPDDAPLELDVEGEFTDEHLAVLAALLCDLAENDNSRGPDQGAAAGAVLKCPHMED